MAFHYLIRSNHFWKLRHSQLRSPISSCGVKQSALHFGEDKKWLQVSGIKKDDCFIDIKQQQYSNLTSSNNMCHHNALPCTPVSVSFPYERNHEHNQREYTPNSKHSILSAACLYFGALLLGSSLAFCDSQDSEDDVEIKTHIAEAEECPTCCTKSSAHYFSSRHCSTKHASLNSCFVASKNGSEHICGSNASDFVDVPYSSAQEEIFLPVEKVENIHRIQPSLSDHVDAECQDFHVSSSPSDSVLQKKPAVHLDGKSDGDSSYKEKLQNAITRSTAILKSKLTMSGAVGASIAVMLDGELVWAQGMGYCHVESATTCSCHSKYRIASISKSITATIAMALWEDGLLDLDAPISKYLPDYPKQIVDGKEVTITTHHLLTHSSGIRHYGLKKPSKSSEDPSNKEAEGNRSVSSSSSKEVKSGQKANSSQDDKRKHFKKYVESRREALVPQLNAYKILDEKSKKKREKDDSADLWEYYINKPYNSVAEAVDLFKDDELFFAPGSGFLYTSHGYTLLSRVLEAASGTPFQQLAENVFQNLGLNQTQPDFPRAIVARRAACYERDEHHQLRNAPQVNNSYKWAGGGFMSSAVDLVRFGSVLLYSLHATDHMIQEHNVQPGFLKASTVQKMWSPYFYHNPEQAFTRNFVRGYGLGWCVQVPRMDQYDKRAAVSPSARKNLVDGTEVEDDSYVRISAPWGSSKRRPSNVPPPEPKVAPGEEVSVDDALEGSKVSPDSHAPVEELPGVIPAIQKVSKSVIESKALPETKVALNSLPENELESSGWIEGDPIGGRNCRGCSRCGYFAAYHTGAAIGGSSILLIMPQPSGEWLIQRQDDADRSGDQKNLKGVDSAELSAKASEKDYPKSDKKKVPYRSVMAARSSWNGCPLCESKRDGEVETSSELKEHVEVQGIVVALLTSYTGVDFTDEAFKIAREFSAVTA